MTTEAKYIGALDQGTTSTRFIVFDRDGEMVAVAQKEHRQIYPQPGWVEHDPEEIWLRTRQVIGEAMAQRELRARDLAAIGITNQRETAILWNSKTGKAVCNAQVWQDMRIAADVAEFSRDGGQERFRAKTGLPLATYFSALKLRWMLRNVSGAREAAERGDLIFGTVDSYLVWLLTGGVDGGAHVTDVTNASRTQLMNLATLDWDEELLKVFEIPRGIFRGFARAARIMGRRNSSR
jgi:glycerol kinase